MKPTPDEPRAPADAYHRMAAELPEWYFETPPPPRGLIVHVRGADRIWTQWAMAIGLYQAIEPALRRHRLSTRATRPARGASTSVSPEIGPALYRKRPIVVEAIQVPHDDDLVAWGALAAWLQMRCVEFEAMGDDGGLILCVEKSGGAACTIEPEGWVIAEPDGVGVYPCTSEQFAATYERVTFVELLVDASQP